MPRRRRIGFGIGGLVSHTHFLRDPVAPPCRAWPIINASSASRELDHPKPCSEAAPPVVPPVRRSRHGFWGLCDRSSRRIGEFWSARWPQGWASTGKRTDFAARWKQAGHRYSRSPQALLGGSRSFDHTSTTSDLASRPGVELAMKPVAALRNSRRFIAVECLAGSRAITATAVPFGLRHCQQDRRGLSA